MNMLKLNQVEEGAIWIVTLDNPPANTLSLPMLDELEAVCERFSVDASARVLILTGAGERAFSAGADINEIMSIDSPKRGRQLAERGHKLCNKIEHIEKPVIAAINALCLGGGNEIAMACHMRIASENAKFSQPEINIGIIPGFGGTQRLRRLVGASRALKLILTGDVVSATEAFTLGLVDEVVAKGQVLNQTTALAKRIIRNSPVGTYFSQRVIHEGLEMNFQQALDLEIDYFEKVCNTEDMGEGLKAFKEKRLPIFKGK